MSVEWQAPCGCIIEFNGQTVDKGAPIKAHKKKCVRHSVADHVQAANVAFDDSKFKERVRAEMDADGSFTSAQFDLFYDVSGPVKLVIHKTLNTPQKAAIESKITAKFGVGAVAVSYG